MELKEFGEAIFGEPKVEWSSSSATNKTHIHTFLFHVDVHDDDSCRQQQLKFQVTDFFSHTFGALLSLHDLNDMRDDIGVGGSWSEFLEYLVNSLKFGDVKLVLNGQPNSDGPKSAKLIAQKSKGMPRIPVSLLRLVGTAANEAMSRLSLDMYKAYKSNHMLLLQEKEGRNQLTKMLSAEKEKSEHVQKQLDGLYSIRHKPHKITSDTSSASGLNDISDKQTDQNPSPMKAPKRVVPAHRRSKVRGAFLQDTEDD